MPFLREIDTLNPPSQEHICGYFFEHRSDSDISILRIGASAERELQLWQTEIFNQRKECFRHIRRARRENKLNNKNLNSVCSLNQHQHP